MKQSSQKDIPVEKMVGFILDILNPIFLIIVMIVIKDKIHSLVDNMVIEGIGYIFSGFTILIPFFSKRIFQKIPNKTQGEMVVYVLYNIPLIFGFIYFLLGGSLRYSLGFAIVTMGYFLLAGRFVFGESDE